MKSRGRFYLMNVADCARRILTTKRHFLLAIGFHLLAGSVCNGDAPPRPSSVYRLLAPEGFVDVANLNDYFRKMSVGGVPVGASVWGSYYQPDAVARMLKGEAVGLVPYCRAFRFPSAASSEVAKSDFALLAQRTKAEVYRGLNLNDPAFSASTRQLEKVASDANGCDAIKVGNNVCLGVVEDTENCISFATRMTVAYTQNGKTENYTSSVSACFVLIQGSIFSLLVQYPDDGRTSQEMANKVLAEWVKAIRQDPNSVPMDAVLSPSSPPHSQIQNAPITDPIQIAVWDWEKKVRASDPRYDGVAAQVKARVLKLISTEGAPQSPDKAVEMAARAYREVTQSANADALLQKYR